MRLEMTADLGRHRADGGEVGPDSVLEGLPSGEGGAHEPFRMARRALFLRACRLQRRAFRRARSLLAIPAISCRRRQFSRRSAWERS